MTSATGRRNFMATGLLLAAVLVLAGCNSTAPAPPVISGLSPNSVNAGSPAFTLKVIGTGFLNTDVVTWNGSALATQPVSSTELDAQVPASLIQAAAAVKAAARLGGFSQPHAQATPEQTGDITIPVTVFRKPPGSTESNTLPFTITPSGPTQDFSISASPSSQTVTAGQGTTYGLTIGTFNGFTGMVHLNVSGLPTGATGSFTPSSVTGSGTSSLAVLTTSSSTPAGTSILTITGTSGSLTHTATVMLVVNPAPTPVLKITKTHTGKFTQGQTGATFTLSVSNTGTGPTSGTVAIMDTPPTGLAITGISGTSWACNPTTVTCTRSDALAAGSSYPAIAVTVNVATNAPSSVTNMASISGGGSAPSTTSDAVTINAATPTPALAIAKTHVGNFNQGGTGAYTITVSNTGTGPTSGTVSVTDTIPAGLTPLTLSGTGWTCSIGATVGCSRTDSLAGASSYPPITLTVSVSTAAPATVMNNVVVTNGSLTASASDPTVINSPGPAFTVTGIGPTSATFNNNMTVYFTVQNTGTSPTSGTITVQIGSPSSLFLPVSIFGDPWNCQSGTLTCTRSDVLAPGQSYPPIGISFQIVSGGPSPFTVSATVSGGGAASNASLNVATPVFNCSPSSGVLCGQFALFAQGYTALVGPRAIAGSFTADGNGNITAGILDINGIGRSPTTLAVLPGAPTGYAFESNGFGNIVLNTSAGAFTFKFIQNNAGNFADVIEFEPTGTIGASGFLVQQNPAYLAATVNGPYALGLLGGLGGASAGVRLGMIGAANANGACGFSASGSTGTINSGGSVSTAANFSGTLNPASCTVDPVTGRGTASFSSVTGSPTPPFSSANFVYYVLGTNVVGQATGMILLSSDPTTATHPLLSGNATLQANAPYNTNNAIDCGLLVLGLPTGCVFASSGATGGNVLTGNGHVSAGLATVTTQSNTAGAMNLLLDDNKAGVITSGNVAATYSYTADGTGVITPASGETVAFVLTGTDSGIILGTGGSVAFGSFVPQTGTDLATSNPTQYIASTRFEATEATANTLVNSTFTPSTPPPVNVGMISGNTRSWSNGSPQFSNTLSGSYATAGTGRGTGTTSATNGIDGATSFVYYVVNANSFVLIGTETTGTGSNMPVLMSFQALN